MDRPGKLAAYLAGLVVVFAGAFGVGHLVGPTPAPTPAGHLPAGSHDAGDPPAGTGPALLGVRVPAAPPGWPGDGHPHD